MSDEHASPQDAAAAPPPTPQTYTPNPRYTAAIPVGGEDTEAALPPELESKLQKRADATKAFLDRVSNGERPILEGGSSQGAHWLGNLIDNASQQGHLPGAPKDYYRAPTYSPEMGYNPASANMVKDSQEIEQDAKENLDIKVRVFGTRRFLTRSQLKKERADCDALIAIPGDNTAIAELNDEITRRFQKFKESKTSFSRPLIIQNDDGYYDALLAQLQLVEYANDEQGKKQRTQIDPERLALSTAIYITKDKDETKTLLSDIRGQIDSPPKPRSREFMSEEKKKTSDAAKTNTPIIPAGATIFVATGTRKKYRELCDIYEKQGLDVNVLPIDLLLDHYVSPPEDGYSYEANAAKKVKAATEAWDRMSDAAKEEKLDTIGIKLHDLGRKRTPTPLKTNEVYSIFHSGVSFFQFRV